MQSYPGLPRETPQYLRALAAHNDRAWFEHHRKAYETAWKTPALDLIEALAPFCQSCTPRLEAVPKPGGSLRRIHRDIRFSNDKTPYSATMHLRLTLTGGASKHAGMHLVLHPDHLAFGAGEFGLSPEALSRFRTRVQNPKDRATLLKAAAEAEAAGSAWDAPDLKRLPSGFTAEPEWDHLLRRKSIILRGQTEGLPDWLFTPDCLTHLQPLIAAHLPLLAWLTA